MNYQKSLIIKLLLILKQLKQSLISSSSTLPLFIKLNYSFISIQTSVILPLHN